WVYFMRAFGILFLIGLPVSPMVAYLFAAWMGVFWLGTVPLTQGLIGQIYGLRYAATLSGIAFLGHQVGSFIGVWIGGYAYQATGSYIMIWWAGIILAVVAAVLCLPIKEEPLAQAAPARPHRKPGPPQRCRASRNPCPITAHAASTQTPAIAQRQLYLNMQVAWPCWPYWLSPFWVI